MTKLKPREEKIKITPELETQIEESKRHGYSIVGGRDNVSLNNRVYEIQGDYLVRSMSIEEQMEDPSVRKEVERELAKQYGKIVPLLMMKNSPNEIEAFHEAFTLYLEKNPYLDDLIHALENNTIPNHNLYREDPEMFHAVRGAAEGVERGRKERENRANW